MELLTVDDFQPHVGTVFTLPGDEKADALHFTLVEALPIKNLAMHGQREPFELTFREPGPTAYEQGLYRLVHPAMGEQLIFMVPNARSETDGVTYIATFN